MVVLLLPIIAVILLCDTVGGPLSLMRDTECPYIDREHVFQAVVTDYPSRAKKTYRLSLSNRLILYLDTMATLPSLGDTVLFRTRIQRGGVSGRFDYGRYLRLQGIIGSGYASSANFRILSPAGRIPLHLLPRYIQHRLALRLRSLGFQPREESVLEALLLGYKEDLAPETKRAFQASGAAHVLAVSGLHTGIIYSILWTLLTLGGRRKPLYEERGKRIALSIIILLGLWTYSLITGFCPSVVRAAIMASVFQLGYMCYRPVNARNSVAAAAVLILLFSPRSLFSASMQLSFAAVVAILWAIKIIDYRHPITDFVLVSLAAWLGTLPLTLYYFGQMSNYFLLTGMAVIPLAWCAVVGGIACLLFGSVPWLGEIVTTLTQWVTWLMNTITAWVESLPGAVTRLSITPPMVALLYGAILCLFFGTYLLTTR